MTNLRHHLNDYLLAYGGHIGYSVRPSERKNGYASQMLRLTLEKARERGISKVRICCDHYNIASAKRFSLTAAYWKMRCLTPPMGC